MLSFMVNTGFGYFLDAAEHIIAKAELPPRVHPIRAGFSYIELSTAEELEAIKIWQDPVQALFQENEAKIQTKIRRTAIDALIADGQLPGDFE